MAFPAPTLINMRLPHELRSIVLACVLPFSAPLLAQEVCDNGLDDDFDGLIDLNDTTDCTCIQVFDSSTVVTSVIPNPSFECYTALPTGISQLNNACTWVQATTPTTDYFVDLPGGYFPSPPIMPMPLPDGDACVGGFYAEGWQEYLGACLTSPLLAGTSYTLSMYVAMTGIDGAVISSSPLVLPPTEVVIYGSPTCVALPLSTTDCPAVAPYAWDILGTYAYTPVNAWQQIQITFTPSVDYEMVMIGPPCGLVTPFAWGGSGYAPFMFYDDLTLNETALFNVSSIEEIGTWCNNNLQLVASPDTLTGVYQWYYEGVAIGGATDTILDVSVLGLSPGTYTFIFDLPGGGACSYSEYVLDPPVYPTPTASAAPLDGCQPLDVQFTNTTDPAMIGSTLWDFGDGTPLDTTTNPLHTYADSGTYSVTITVTSPAGCVGTYTYVDWIHVDQAPTALFSVDTLAGCGPLTVNFTNETDPGWFGGCMWYIGTGAPIPGCADFSHTYTAAGTYPVTLVVTSPGGCPSAPADTVYITVYPDPIVQLSSDVVDGCSPLAVQFHNDTDPALTDSVWWDIDDGITTDVEDPGHTYPVPGTYNVSLTVWSEHGCMGDTSIANMITVYGHPVPDFTLDPDSGCYPLEVQFTNLTDAGSTGNCNWTFGDGGTSTDCDPTYTYNAPGIYDVTLIVTSPEGCDGDTTYLDLVTVFDHPVADFMFTPQPTNVYQTDILFLDQSSSDVVAWDWAFGANGVLGSANVPDPGLHFPDQSPGTYPVTLIVTNDHGCQDTVVYEVVIDPSFSVFVPNTFTPDGDGVNDYFYPMIQDDQPEAYKLYIYDRWGEKVFESTDRYNVWAGTFMNHGGDILPQGVYVWRLITAPIADDKVRKEYMGHVTLLK